MTNELRDPLRWAESGSDAPGELRALLQAGREDLPSAGQLAEMFARLEPKLTPSPTGAAPPGGSLTPLMKGLGVVALVGGLSGALYLSRGKEAPPPEKPTVSAPAPRISAPASAPVASTAVAAREEVTEVAPLAPAPSAHKAPPKGTVSLPSEAELLESARRALAKNPTLALRLTAQHRARFPKGMLQQEREVLAIEALRRLGRAKEADARADAFENRFPESAHRRGVEAGLKK